LDAFAYSLGLGQAHIETALLLLLHARVQLYLAPECFNPELGKLTEKVGGTLKSRCATLKWNLLDGYLP